MEGEATSRRGYVDRLAETILSEALTDSRVVLLAGARQVGKSTLARHVLRGAADVRVVNLDDVTTREAAQADPVGTVTAAGVVFVDEIQRVPELLLAIKAEVDRDPRPGRYLLTGSADVMALPQVADSLAGRMEIVELWPFAQAEMLGVRPPVLDWLLDAGDMPGSQAVAVSRDELLDRVVRGGYPEAVQRAERRRRSAWYRSYLSAFVQRDVRDVVDIEHTQQLPRLLRLIAARTANLLNVAQLSKDASLPESTVRRYLDVLEQTYLVKRLPGWSTNLTSRAVKAPKLHMADSGMAAYLIGADARSLARPGGVAGPLVETFVAMELFRLAAVSDRELALFHLRTKEGTEVDVVIEAADGAVAGVEVKAGSTVRGDDFKGLRALQRLAGDAFRGGVVLYTGAEVRSFGHRLWAAPVSQLWAGGAG